MMAVSLSSVVLAVLAISANTVNCAPKHDENVIHFEKSAQTSFQGCLLSCVDKDLCCSCKESGKLAMNAAMINDLSKTCATKDVSKCSKAWLDSWINDELAGASNCTSKEKVEREIGRCISQCNGRPLSKPLDPYHTEQYPGHLTEISDLHEYTEPDFTEFCIDIRAGSMLCTVYGTGSYTAGNTLCRSGNRCGFHGYKYSWCYVDFSGKWDYCCTGHCGFGAGKDYMWCDSGNTWQYCGRAGNRDIQGRKCIRDYPCGMHQENGKASYYWCYVDMKKNWDRCCEPWSICSRRGASTSWCFTGYKKGTGRKDCKRKIAANVTMA